MPEPTTRTGRPKSQPTAPQADTAPDPQVEDATATGVQPVTDTGHANTEQPTPDADTLRFTRDQVIDDSFVLVEQQSFVVAAAIAQSDANTFNKPELRELVDAFLSTEVQ